MVPRVIEQGWTLAAAAEAAGVSERTCAKWLARYRGEGPAGLVDRSSAPQRDPASHARGPRRGDRGAAPAADDRRRDRAVSRDGALDRLGGARPDRAGQALAAGAARAAEPLSSAAAPASWCTSTSRSSAASGRRRPPRHRPRQPRASRRRHGAARAAGSTCTSASTTPPAWPTSRCSPTSRPPPPRLPAPRGRVLQPPRHPRERVMTDNGSAYRSSLHALRLPRARHPPPAHPPLPAAHQRQSRALHPHPARRLGLRRDLRHQRRTHRSP